MVSQVRGRREPRRVRADDFQQEVGKWHRCLISVCISYSSWHYDKVPGQCNPREGRFISAHDLRSSTLEGKVVGIWMLRCGFSPFLHSRTPFPTSVEPPWKHPHRHTQRRISGIISDVDKLTVRMSRYASTITALGCHSDSLLALPRAHLMQAYLTPGLFLLCPR